MELEKVYQYFSEGGFGSQVSFLSENPSESHIQPPQEIPPGGLEVWENLGFD